MAKKSSGPNKSQAIRDYYNAHPDAKPKQVSEELKKMGVDVTPAFISTIKSTSQKQKKKTQKSPTVRSAKPGRVGRPAGSTSTSGSVTIDSLVKAKSLVRELGGLDNAMATLSALKKLAD